MSDYGASFVLSKLLRRVRRLAPDINLVVTQDSRSGMLEQIAQGKVDLALGVFPSLPVDVCVEVLFEETFSCLLDRSTLPAGARIAYDTPPVEGLEHHLVLQSGRLTLTVDGTDHALTPGDCLRYRLHGQTVFLAGTDAPAHYLLFLV